MNLRVIHLIRKVERIDRDLEELDTLLGTLQMDREYSLRLRDSLIEESFRLKQLRQKISSQVIRIPNHFEDFVESTVPALRKKAEVRPAVTATPAESQRSAVTPVQKDPEGSQPRPQSDEKPAQAVGVTEGKPSEIVPVERPQRRGDKKKPPFLFRFE